MKTFIELTQDQQMDALDGAKLALAQHLIDNDIVLNLIRYDVEITDAIHLLKHSMPAHVSPEDLVAYLDQVPTLKIPFLHEAGRMVKRATYSDVGTIVSEL
jgi:hypothetical protein